MAAGIIYQTVTTTSGETVELAFYVDDTVTPTTWIPARLAINTAGNPAAFGTGARGATVPRVTIATDDLVPVTGTITAVTALTNALPAGTNAIGKLAANSGVDIGDVDVTSVPADPFGVNADAASVSTSISAKLKGIATALGITALDLGTGTGGSRTLRFFKDTAQWIGGAGAVTSAVQRTTLASDDPAVAVLGTTADAASATTTIKGALRALVTAIGTTAWDLGSGTGGTRTQRTIIDSSQIGVQQTTAQAMSAGYTLVALPSNQVWPTGQSPKSFSAAFTTNTRPANTTAYSAADSISNNATAGSVTALTATVSDTNDDLVTLTDILVTSTDTGLAGKRIRAYLFNSDPTANSGVSGGDNAAYAQKVAGYIGSMSGVMETGFSDGTVGRLVPSYNDGAAASTPNAPAGGLVVVKPTSGAKTLFIQYQAIDGFTPSANSTTIIGTARGFQSRVA